MFDPDLDSRRLFGRALQLADEAVESTVDGDALVVASIGPYGTCLHDGSEYTGSYLDTVSVEDLEKWHFERIKRLAVAGAELLAVETMPSVVEAKAVLNVLRAFKGVQCWISFQCRDGAHTARGERFDTVMRELIRHPAYSTRVVAVGVNCVAPKDVAPLLRLANKVNRHEEWPEEMTFRTVPYVVYPNSGEKWEDAKWSGDKDDLEVELVKRVPQWMKLGATVVGGCCRVTPAVISKISEKVKECAIDVFEYRRKHASVCKKGDFESMKQKFIDLGKLETRAKKDEVILPSDLIGRIEVLPPGHVDRDQAEAKLRKLFEHFNEPYPLDDAVDIDNTEEEPSDES